MRLAAPSTVLSLVGIQPSPGATKAAEEALDVTFPQVESVVESRLAFATITDTFLLPFSLRTNLRLTSGFLASERLTMSVEVPHLVLRNEGVVQLLSPFEGTLTIKYSTGYPTKADGLSLDNPNSQLASAHAYLAASALLLAPGAVSKDKAKSLGATAAYSFSNMAYSMLQGFHRPRASVVWPSHTKG